MIILHPPVKKQHQNRVSSLILFVEWTCTLQISGTFNIMRKTKPYAIYISNLL